MYNKISKVKKPPPSRTHNFSNFDILLLIKLNKIDTKIVYIVYIIHYFIFQLKRNENKSYEYLVL